MSDQEGLSARTRAFYSRSMVVLAEAGVPFMVGGAYALAPVTGIERHTKDLDLFLRPDDRDRALDALAAAGCRVEVTFPHWLAKAFDGEGDGARFIDLIYCSGNGLSEVDDEWFAHAVEAEVLGVPALLSPVEESLWTKAFIMERERFDGADVAHLLLLAGPTLDWDRLLRRFGLHWRVLLAHLVLFGFIYPAARDIIPTRVLDALTDRLRTETVASPPHDEVCQGTLLSRAQYLSDVDRIGLQDVRLAPRGSMTEEDVRRWTEAIPDASRPAPPLPTTPVLQGEGPISLDSTGPGPGAGRS